MALNPVLYCSTITLALAARAFSAHKVRYCELRLVYIAPGFPYRTWVLASFYSFLEPNLLGIQHYLIRGNTLQVTFQLIKGHSGNHHFLRYRTAQPNKT